MDIITHAATGVLVSTAFDDPLAKTACIVGSVLPDITLAPLYIKAFRARKTWKGGLRLVNNAKGRMPKRFYTAYWLSHSLVPISLLTVASYLGGLHIVFALCIGYITHILWDIPTHTHKYACRPFYPFSRQLWSGYGNWWNSHLGIGIMALSWLVLGTAYFFVP